MQRPRSSRILRGLAIAGVAILMAGGAALAAQSVAAPAPGPVDEPSESESVDTGAGAATD